MSNIFINVMVSKYFSQSLFGIIGMLFTFDIDKSETKRNISYILSLQWRILLFSHWLLLNLTIKYRFKLLNSALPLYESHKQFIGTVCSEMLVKYLFSGHYLCAHCIGFVPFRCSPAKPCTLFWSCTLFDKCHDFHFSSFL